MEPIPDGVTIELEKLKLRLSDMSADDITVEQTKQMATEIGAIRLHLKRLALDQQAMMQRLDR